MPEMGRLEHSRFFKDPSPNRSLCFRPDPVLQVGPLNYRGGWSSAGLLLGNMGWKRSLPSTL